jgi:type IV pilus assembly protein PilV
MNHSIIIKSHPRRRNRSKGLSLLESLVSLFVLALGVLGMLGVQLRTMADNQTANHRTTATRVVDDLFERFKTNPGNVLPQDPTVDAQWTVTDNYAKDWGNDTVKDGTNCADTACDTAARAQYDLKAFESGLKNSGLPDGRALVVRSPNTFRQLVVIVGWRTKAIGDAGGTDDQKAALAAPFQVAEPGITTPDDCKTTHTCFAVYGQP